MYNVMRFISYENDIIFTSLAKQRNTIESNLWMKILNGLVISLLCRRVSKTKNLGLRKR